PTTARRATTGTTISYQDTLAATTTFTVLQSSAGIRRGKSCVAPPKRPSRHRAKRCTRFRVMGSFTHVDAAGANRPHFSGRLRGRKLKPGSYRLQAVARNAAGQSSATMVASFRVTP